MNRPRIPDVDRCFIPSQAYGSASVAGIVALIGAIAVTAFSWLFFETSSPAIAAICGGAAGGLLFVVHRRKRPARSQPSLLLCKAGVIIQDPYEKIVIPWEELAEVRHIVVDVESLEFRCKAGVDPVVLVIEHFTREQAKEIKRWLLPEAA